MIFQYPIYSLDIQCVLIPFSFIDLMLDSDENIVDYCFILNIPK